MGEMTKSGLAMAKVLESWGVNHIYGIPGGSINSTMIALYEERHNIRFIQVRHEEVGALAAAADAKLTGKIGVCFGSAGPGATHLFNGLYDAKMDHVPLLAIVGQVVSSNMNYDYFQEMNENPIFADVSVYNRTVMTPESLPHVIDEAIRRAYKYQGVAVVTLPQDYGFVDIPDTHESTAKSHRKSLILPDVEDVKAAVKLIEAAEKPVLYVGQGTRGARDEVLALSDHFSMPIVASVLAKGIIPDEAENFLGMSGRLSTKPANEVMKATDLIVFIGSDFPFAQSVFSQTAKFIQVDIDSAKLGKRHKTDVAILGDAKETMKQMVQIGNKKPVSQFLEANRQNRQNWRNWLKSFENSDHYPLRVEPIFKEINRIATDDAIFVSDIGNSSVESIRLLNMNGDKQQFTISGWFATMGNGIPGGIAAKLSYPGRQVFTLSGDGGFAMVMQDIVTQVKYSLPVINIVFSNDSLGYIEAEQEDEKQTMYGVCLHEIDFAKAAEAMGAKGYTITHYEQIQSVFDEVQHCDKPVVIDVKIDNTRPFPAEAMILDPEKYSKAEIEAFTTRYQVRDMPLLSELLKQ